MHISYVNCHPLPVVMSKVWYSKIYYMTLLIALLVHGLVTPEMLISIWQFYISFPCKKSTTLKFRFFLHYFELEYLFFLRFKKQIFELKRREFLNQISPPLTLYLNILNLLKVGMEFLRNFLFNSNLIFQKKTRSSLDIPQKCFRPYLPNLTCQDF